jgi:hypothetical protein
MICETAGQIRDANPRDKLKVKSTELHMVCLLIADAQFTQKIFVTFLIIFTVGALILNYRRAVFIMIPLLLYLGNSTIDPFKQLVKLFLFINRLVFR